MDLAEVIKKPIITEKATQESAFGKYSFAVDKRANKKEIARAVAKFLGVTPQKVWTMVRSGQKRAIVQLAEGEKIDLFETGE
jgi:large subunit ribosomal protein L23